MPAILTGLTFQRTVNTTHVSENMRTGERVETDRATIGRDEYTAEFMVQGQDARTNQTVGRLYVTVRGDGTKLPGDRGIDDVGAWIAANLAEILSTPPVSD